MQLCNSEEQVLDEVNSNNVLHVIVVQSLPVYQQSTLTIVPHPATTYTVQEKMLAFEKNVNFGVEHCGIVEKQPNFRLRVQGFYAETVGDIEYPSNS